MDKEEEVIVIEILEHLLTHINQATRGRTLSRDAIVSIGLSLHVSIVKELLKQAPTTDIKQTFVEAAIISFARNILELLEAPSEIKESPNGSNPT